MTQVLREVRLYGALGKQFGRIHRLAVESAAEAVRALCAVLDGFEAYLCSKRSAAGYRVWAGPHNLAEGDLPKPTGAREVIRIVPVVAGAKRQGLGQVLAGAALVVAGALLTPTFPMLGPAAVKIGFGMAIGGVIQMLSPQHKVNREESPKGVQSYSFGGAINTDEEGGCVPLLYGRLLVGSLVISGGIRTADVAL